MLGEGFFNAYSLGRGPFEQQLKGNLWRIFDGGNIFEHEIKDNGGRMLECYGFSAIGSLTTFLDYCLMSTSLIIKFMTSPEFAYYYHLYRINVSRTYSSICKHKYDFIRYNSKGTTMT